MTPTGWLTRDGFRLAVHDAGGAGRPVIFQHGLCGDARQTAEAFPADERFRRVTLECRGHGKSEFDSAPSLDTSTRDVAALAESLGAPLPVGGISMGAAIALRLAVTRPDLVSHLILVRPAWDTDDAPPNLAPNVEVGELLASMPADAAREHFMASATAARLAKESPDNLASLTGSFTREPLRETATLLTTLSRQPLGLGADDLAKITIPVLVCETAEDAIHPAALARSLASKIPDARLVTLPPKGRGKPAHLAALHAAITHFLTET